MEIKGRNKDVILFLIFDLCLGEMTLSKIMGTPWKEGEIRLEVDKGLSVIKF